MGHGELMDRETSILAQAIAVRVAEAKTADELIVIARGARDISTVMCRTKGHFPWRDFHIACGLDLIGFPSIKQLEAVMK